MNDFLTKIEEYKMLLKEELEKETPNNKMVIKYRDKIMWLSMNINANNNNNTRQMF